MRMACVLVAMMVMVPLVARAAPPQVAVFDFEFIDTSLQGEVDGPRPDERGRLMRAGDQVRKALVDSGKFTVLDIAPVNVAAHGSNLQACGGCEVQLARQIGADLVITGTVQKVSNLILNINFYLRDVHTGQLVRAMSADMRGNTDESWTRAADYLLRNRLLAPNYGAPQAQ
jgi:Protein of unknown function (DUF2380)